MCFGVGEGTLLWSGDLEGILIGWRAFEKRWKLGEATGDSGGREVSRETLVRRGPAGRLTDDCGEDPFFGEDTPPLEEDEAEASSDTLASLGGAGFRPEDRGEPFCGGEEKPVLEEDREEMEDLGEDVEGGSADDFLCSKGLAFCGAELMVLLGAFGLPAGETFTVLTTILLDGFGLSLDEGSSYGDEDLSFVEATFDPEDDLDKSFTGDVEEELTFLDPTGLLFGEDDEVFDDVTVTFLVMMGLLLPPLGVVVVVVTVEEMVDFEGLFFPPGGALLTLPGGVLLTRRVERGLDLGELVSRYGLFFLGEIGLDLLGLDLPEMGLDLPVDPLTLRAAVGLDVTVIPSLFRTGLDLPATPLLGLNLPVTPPAF